MLPEVSENCDDSLKSLGRQGEYAIHCENLVIQRPFPPSPSNNAKKKKRGKGSKGPEEDDDHLLGVSGGSGSGSSGEPEDFLLKGIDMQVPKVSIYLSI